MLPSQGQQCGQHGTKRTADRVQSGGGIGRFRLTRSTLCSCASLCTDGRRTAVRAGACRAGGRVDGRRDRGRRALLADHLLGDFDARGRADLLGVLDSRVLASLVAGVLEAASDAVDEVFVGADALDLKLLAAGDLVARGPFLYAGLLWRRIELGLVLHISGEEGCR